MRQRGVKGEQGWMGEGVSRWRMRGSGRFEWYSGRGWAWSKEIRQFMLLRTDGRGDGTSNAPMASCRFRSRGERVLEGQRGYRDMRDWCTYQ